MRENHKTEVKKSYNEFDVQNTAVFFNNLGKRYEEFVKTDYNSIYAQTKRIFQPYLEGNVLNVGSGGVDFSINPNISLMVSLDIAENLLRYHKDTGKNFVICGQSRQLPFKAGSFNVVLTHFSLHHFAQKSVKKTFDYLLDSFTDINKVVKTGGRFVIAENTISDMASFCEKLLYPAERFLLRIFRRPYVYLFSIKILEQLLRKTGFRLIHFETFKQASKALILPFSIPKFINPISISVLIGEKQ